MRQHMGRRSETSRLCVRGQKQHGKQLTSSEGCRAMPRHDEQMPMEWERGSLRALALVLVLAAAQREDVSNHRYVWGCGA